jgi:uncharacterized membrane protein YedE/YeeE
MSDAKPLSRFSPPASERPFWNPYVAGVVLGLVLLASFLLMGFGLGGSGAIARFSIAAAHLVAPRTVESNGYFSPYVGPGKRVLEDWLVFEVLGVFLGATIGAYSAGRLRLGIDRGPAISRGRRLVLAAAGGVLMGIAARLARGCTSGQALTGGAVLSVGSWIFMLAVFAGGYLVAPLVRRQWR